LSTRNSPSPIGTSGSSRYVFNRGSFGKVTLPNFASNSAYHRVIDSPNDRRASSSSAPREIGRCGWNDQSTRSSWLSSRMVRPLFERSPSSARRFRSSSIGIA